MKIIKKLLIKFKIISLPSILMYIFRIFKIKYNKIVCINYNGRGYGDNPKYIVDELLSRNIDNLKIIWPVKDVKQQFPKCVTPVKLYGIKYFYHLSTSKIWVNTSRFHAYVRKRKNQYYIQTWHGGLGLKKIERDVEEKLPEYYIICAKNDSKMTDYMISNCKHIENLYKTVFWYSGEVAALGSPRNDIFFKQELSKELNVKIRNKYNIPIDKKIILYAPTFRDNYEFDYTNIDYERIIEQISRKYNDDYVFAVRLHPKLAGKYNFEDKKNIYDFTDYPDAYELLLAVDELISDYSSIFFDFMYLNRPIYLYAPDYDAYMGDRGLYFDYKKLPFPIAYSKEELTEKIVNNDYENKIEEINKFKSENELLDDGHASERVCNLIEELLKK